MHTQALLVGNLSHLCLLGFRAFSCWWWSCDHHDCIRCLQMAGASESPTIMPDGNKGEEERGRISLHSLWTSHTQKVTWIDHSALILWAIHTLKLHVSPPHVPRLMRLPTNFPLLLSNPAMYLHSLPHVPTDNRNNRTIMSREEWTTICSSRWTGWVWEMTSWIQRLQKELVIV